jgi:hypothetical protein
MRGELRDYRQDIEVDADDLEGEWITHPSIYMHYSEIYAEACADRDDAKLKMEWIAANIDLDIRKNWDTKYGFETKPSENAIKNTILINKKYLAAYREYNKKVKRVNSMTGVKTAFEHKKHSLANLVSLKIGGFYAEPRNKIRDIKKLLSSGAHDRHQEDLAHKMKLRKEVREKTKVPE